MSDHLHLAFIGFCEYTLVCIPRFWTWPAGSESRSAPGVRWVSERWLRPLLSVLDLGQAEELQRGGRPEPPSPGTQSSGGDKLSTTTWEEDDYC